MLEVRTLLDMLAYRAQNTPEQTAFTYADQPTAFGGLWRCVNQFGTYLQQQSVNPGDRVVIALPNGPDFFSAFYGTLRAGAIAAPIFPDSSPERMLAMMALCGARRLVVPSDLTEAQREELKQQMAGRPFDAITVGESQNCAPETPFPSAQPEDVAFIQYTSGSTGNPKGVQLSHRNLITNIRQLIAGFRMTPAERVVSWLPVYHDMGLILMTMAPFYLGAQLTLLPTSLRNTHDWLEAIAQHRGTFTAAPDFAYRLCLQRARQPQRYDLSSLRVALNAAEPVRAQTIRGFERAFGLDRVMIAGYGLAEATVGVSAWPPQTPMKVDAQGHVSVGRPFPGVEVTILQDSHPAAPGVIGEIAIRSPANTRGYYRNAAATQDLFWQAGAILSGDLGYIDADGDLFVVGRSKNIIIHAGHTVYPEDIAEVVEAAPRVRRAAAVGVDKGGHEGEQVYVFAEVRGRRNTPDDQFEDMVIDIVRRFQTRFGFRPGRVYLVKPRTIPMTYNAKLQHQQLREQYVSRQLFDEGRILFPNY